jgi:serine/threonine protein kinase
LPIPGILGDYRILREVGRGGMGIVYEAEQLSLKRRVALKVLPFAAVLDSRQLQRFKNEAQAAAALRHPNIVQVFAIGCERGVHYYAMEYIEGQTVAEAIAELAQPKNAQESTAVTDPSTQPSRLTSRGQGDSVLKVISSAASSRSPEFLRTVAKLGIQAAEALEHAHRISR